MLVPKGKFSVPADRISLLRPAPEPLLVTGAGAGGGYLKVVA